MYSRAHLHSFIAKTFVSEIEKELKTDKLPKKLKAEVLGEPYITMKGFKGVGVRMSERYIHIVLTSNHIS